MSSATGSRVVPEQRADVWRALAVLGPYCPVCDVSYVVTGSGRRTTFVAVPGRLDGEPPEGAPQGRILEWAPGRVVVTQVELTPETWTTRIELEDASAGGTSVTLTVSHEARGRGRLAGRLLRRAARPMVQRTVESELDKVPAHIALLHG
ncbi:SRPBCC family protein [Blastococcus goldschmidtiae]|uniref:SRPBCC family protein n=1 Tax=Blastococcus goldschmidtiae TaxID=3075546 RepID=A0ABU2K2E6_9ACTN|nr:SRPBCC family protein [Blastococcus sp. DSM 46792]MDT0274355.1 SRPBCC family protein [Blastococcus sp. DSM 46792]